MHLDNKKHISIQAAKIVLLLLVVVAGTFSTVGKFLPIETVQAKTCDDGKVVADNAPCPGITSPTPSDSTNSPPGDDFQFFRDAIAWIVYIFTVGIGSFIARIASFFLNFAIFFSLSSTPYALDFLTVAWGTVRDLANLGFIFILIYIAITVTLKADTHNTMPMLAKVIAVALIINFSFFFARVVIDAGNILAVNFYNNAPSLAQAPDLPTGGKDLTLPIMNMIGVTTPLGDKAFLEATKANDWGQLLVMVFIYISMAIILGLLAAIFFTVGIKFIIRVVVLWITIIAAPLALLMYAIPGNTAARYQKEWLSALVTYSLFPAIFLFLYLFIIVNFANSLTCQVTSGSTTTNLGHTILGCLTPGAHSTPAGISEGTNNILDVIGAIGFRLGFLIVLLYMTLLAANKLSSWGGEWAQKITERPERWLRTPANLVYRETVGRAADSLNRRLETSRFANSALLNNPLLGHPVKAIRENVLQPVAGSTLGAGLSRTDSKKAYDEAEKERMTNRRKAQILPVMTELRGLYEEEAKVKAKGGSLNAKQLTRKATLQDQVDNFSKADLETQKIESLVKNASIFKEATIKKAAESDKFVEQGKQNLRTAFEENSKDSHLQRSIEQLIKIQKNSLAIDTEIQQAKTNKTRIDDTWAKNAEIELKLEVDTANSRFRATPTVDNSTKLRKANEALKDFADFNKERKQIIPHVKINEGLGKGFNSTYLP